MDTVTQNPFTAPKIEIPDPPEEFGQDGGKFYRAYDALAEEIDDDMTQSLKEQLDGMLIFAGLFAGVNSAFLALTLPLMSADPADDTNALLAQNNAILLQLMSGRNDTTSLNSTLPSASFAPSGAILSVNGLFALSLSFAIISSFLAVLGRQWLVYYRKRGGGGPDRRRWEQLKRFLGAERWGMELILDDILPSLLQAGLIIFCVSFIIYLNTLNSTLYKVVRVPLYAGLAFFVGSALCTLWDRFCPFHSPLSHLLHWISCLPPRIVRVITPLLRRLTALTRHLTDLTRRLTALIRPSEDRRTRIARRHRRKQFIERWFGWAKPMVCEFNRPFSIISTTVKEWIHRPFSTISATVRRCFSHVPWTHQEETMQSLQVIAIQRTICTSEDPATLLHATANILSITDLDQLKQLWADELFRERFLELRRTSFHRAQQLRGRDQVDFAASAARLYCASATHVLISAHTPEVDSLVHFGKFPAVKEISGPYIWVPRDRLASSSPRLILASLAYSTISIFWGFRGSVGVKYFGMHLDAYCAAVNGESRTLLSLISWMVSRLPQHDDLLSFGKGRDFGSLRTLYVGSDDTTIANLDSAFTALLDPKIEGLLDRDSIFTNLLRCLVQIVDDKQERLKIKPEQAFKLLATCETVLRGIRSSEEARQMLGKLRIGAKTAINDLLPSPNATYPRIPWNILDALSAYFEQRLSIVRKERQALENEDLDVLQIFSPLIRQILRYKPLNWEDVFESEWCDVSGVLREKRSVVRQTFNSFVSELDKAFCHMHNNRDPELSWCHWRGECIADLYSLPPDPETVLRRRFWAMSESDLSA